ncbi:MAG: hypothetical protein AVO35_11795 [Candidatus Aegiribacteria sp. MLS_C]|nr:MAG: hypothetical protein AVO35_11795 [Candidatus Aegiribacteria sp. MLS_C]
MNRKTGPRQATGPRVVARGHSACYPEPVAFSTGDSLSIGGNDDEYPEWLWVVTSEGKEGWAPETFIARNGSEGTALRDYDSNELDTCRGETVFLLEETGGWSLVRNSLGASGWVPSETLGNRHRN